MGMNTVDEPVASEPVASERGASPPKACAFRRDVLCAALPASIRADLTLHILPEVRSTQDTLAELASQGECHAVLCVTDKQTAGRGRQGRIWQGGHAENLQCSLAWEIASAPDPAISLVVGVAIVRALRKLGVKEVGVKWPNDVMCRDAGTGRYSKLGGVLVEASCLRQGRTRRSQYRIGMGINFRLHEAAYKEVDQPVTDLSRQGYYLPREQVLAEVLTALWDCLNRFSQEGFTTLRDEWQGYHVYSHQVMAYQRVDSTSAPFTAMVVGVDARGALGLQVGGEQRYFSSGEIRAVPAKPKAGA